MNTTFLLMIVSTSALLLLGILGYFLYQKRKQLYHSDFQSPHLKEPFFADQPHSFSEHSSSNQSTTSFGNAYHKNAEYKDTDENEKKREHFNSEDFSHSLDLNFEENSYTSPELNNNDENSSENDETDTDPFIVIFLIAETQKPFVGYDLLQAILSAGLRYDNKTNIFHRYESLQGRGTALFSLANANEPGTFNLDRMAEVSCQGLCIFINLEEVKNPVMAFEKMLESVYQLVDDLGGELKNELGQTLNYDTITHYRTRIGDYVALRSYSNIT